MLTSDCMFSAQTDCMIQVRHVASAGLCALRACYLAAPSSRDWCWAAEQLACLGRAKPARLMQEGQAKGSQACKMQCVSWWRRSYP